MAQIKYRRVALLANLPASSALDGDVYFVRENSGWYVWDAVNLVMKATGISSMPAGSGNKVLATPADGSSAVSALRALVVLDIPNLPSSKITGLATVATTGSYTDLSNRPTLATVATTGAYTDLSGKPSIPTSFAWNVETDATGNLSINNAGFTSTFNQTSAVAWLWANTTIATVSSTNASPLLELAANYWTAGSASAQDLWTLQVSLSAGANGKSTLALVHTGSTSTLSSLNVPALSIGAGNGPTNYGFQIVSNTLNISSVSDIGAILGTGRWFRVEDGANGEIRIIPGSQLIGFSTAATPDSGLSRIGASSLAIGNGTAGDFTGALTLGALTQNNNTIATVSSTNASPLHTLSANYWTGAASASDSWTLQSTLGAGTNGASTLTLAHAGSTGTSTIALGANVRCGNWPVQGTFQIYNGVTSFLDMSPGTNILALHQSTVIAWAASGQSVNTKDVGISRIAAGNLAVGNGIAGNATGDMSANRFQAAAFEGPLNTFGVLQFQASNQFTSYSTTLPVLTINPLSASTGNILTYKTAVAGAVIGGVDSAGNLLIGGVDVNISRLAAGSLAIGNGTAGNTTGILQVGAGTVTNPSITLNTNTGMYLGGTSGAPAFAVGNNSVGSFHNAGLRLFSTGVFGISAAGNADTSGADVGFSRIGTANMGLGNGVQGAIGGTLTLATVVLQTVNNGQWIIGQASELLTLSTVGLTTDTVGNLLPANAIIESVVCRVTTTITTTTNWAVGDATIAARFSTANATLAAGTTSVGIQQCDQTGTSGPKQTAAAKVRITCTGANPGAGIVRITVFYRQFVPPVN